MFFSNILLRLVKTKKKRRCTCIPIESSAPQKARINQSAQWALAHERILSEVKISATCGCIPPGEPVFDWARALRWIINSMLEVQHSDLSSCTATIPHRRFLNLGVLWIFRRWLVRALQYLISSASNAKRWGIELPGLATSLHRREWVSLTCGLWCVAYPPWCMYRGTRAWDYPR